MSLGVGRSATARTYPLEAFEPRWDISPDCSHSALPPPNGSPMTEDLNVIHIN